MAKTSLKNNNLTSLFDSVDRDQTWGDLWQSWKDCQRCSLCSNRDKVVVGSGSTTARVLAVGMAPGKDEDISGVPFQGNPGQVCRDYVIKCGGIPESEIFWTNVLGCMPPKNELGPTWSIPWLKACSVRLENIIYLLQPKLIIAMGRRAADYFGIPGLVDTIRGTVRSYKSAKVVVTTMPAQLLRYNKKDKEYKTTATSLEEDFMIVHNLWMEIKKNG